MTELSILLHPDPRLKKISTQVTNIDERIKKLCLDMIDTMYNHSGVGLAAPQVGVLKRVVVMDCSDDGEKSPVTLINPEIVWSSEEVSKFEEGCLSIPHIREEIKRPSSVQVNFTYFDFNIFTLEPFIIDHAPGFSDNPLINLSTIFPGKFQLILVSLL